MISTLDSRRFTLIGSLAAAVALSGCWSIEPEVQRPAPVAQRPAAVIQPAVSVAKPNVIVILADDLGYADVSTYRKGRIPTPNIDRIGQEGAVFTQGYATAPICSPSRAGLLTGRHQQRFGFEFNPGVPSMTMSERRGIDPRELTMADAMRGGGYRTAAIGKWHLGSTPALYPTSRGFDEFWGFLSAQTNHIRPQAPQAVNALASTPDWSTGSIAPMTTIDAPRTVVAGPQREPVDLGNGLLTEQITEQALAFIERNRERPFFLYLAHEAPHLPLQTTRKYYDRFPAIQDRNQRVYASMVSSLDDAVGAVLERLDRLGLADNTIVVFLSDNGCAAYIPDLCSGEPLSGGKLTYLEGGIRVPYLMRWPTRIKAGTTHREPVSSLDILPTAANAAGIVLPRDRVYDGFDLMAQLDRADAARRPPLFWRSLPMRALRDGDWKYVRDLDGVEFLYNLADDPKETRDRAGQEATRLAGLRAQYSQWEADKIAPGWNARAWSFEIEGRVFKFTP